MANPKRIKSSGKTSKQHAAAKQAVKKKSKGAAKFHNEQLRTTLDNDASTLYIVNQISQNPVIAISDEHAVDVLGLTSTLGRL
ncbi:hypothetical protein C0991_001838 [Blastosporella zonata]|nr:hypothetical protein C0991_001838 [Blastosporella zonata]